MPSIAGPGMGFTDHGKVKITCIYLHISDMEKSTSSQTTKRLLLGISGGVALVADCRRTVWV
jgi:hypothetical protein